MKKEIKIKKEHLDIIADMNIQERAISREIEHLCQRKLKISDSFWGFLYANYNLDENKEYTYNRKEKKVYEVFNDDNIFIMKAELVRKWHKFAEENKIDIMKLVK